MQNEGPRGQDEDATPGISPPQSERRAIPRIVWILWLQGWKQAPEVALAARASWMRNPGWTVRALDQESLDSVLPKEAIARIMSGQKEPEAQSDLIRLELLHRYGGVWADATTICLQPLDDWLPSLMNAGFFALADPGPDRPLSTWFLAAERGSIIVERWRQAALDYWRGRESRDHYFWLHNLFGNLIKHDARVSSTWSQVPRRPAANPFHFAPRNPVLHAPAPSDLTDQLGRLAVPIAKLTHKLAIPAGRGSLLDELCRIGRSKPAATAPRQRRLLLAWYGSFAGHGTIGDLRSLEVLASHLIGRGHEVHHATAIPLDIPGAEQVDWQRVDPTSFDASVFVCGPILASHPHTSALFAKLAGTRLAGVGVSLMPEGHPNRANPFELVLAREGGQAAWGDLAILASLPDAGPPRPSRNVPVIGFSLRGKQGEYGLDRCAWTEAEVALRRAAASGTAGGSAIHIMIENHLQRSGQAPDNIEDLYADCGLVLTTRFHGAVCALRRGVPFIALDQIRGGAKVQALLGGLGWPYIYGIENCNQEALGRAAAQLLEGQDQDLLGAARERAVRAANTTLQALDGWVDVI